jgi:hypothetical protein
MELAFFVGALIFVKNYKMMKFLHILQEKTKKKLLPKMKSKINIDAIFRKKRFIVFINKFSFGSHFEFCFRTTNFFIFF